MEEQTTTISDDETEMQETPSKDAASKIMEGLNTMTARLKKISDEAEMEHQMEEERKAKRPRESKDVGSSFPSMQPFGMPHQR